MATVTFDGATRVNDADANTDWNNYGSGGPSPASEPQLRYQYSGTGSVGAVNKKVTSTTSRTGVEYNPGSGAVDMTAAANPLWFAKVYVADFGDLNSTFGVGLIIGSANNAYYEYNVAGTGANRSVFNTYPAQGGYLIVAINPSISAWREGTGTGTPALSAIDYFAVGAQFVVGGAKSENVAMDAIDIGRGLLLTGTSGSFADFLSTDQDTIANRWGVVTGNAPVINARGLLTIGSATATTFSDSTYTVLFVDGYHGPGDVGTKFDLQNASTDITLDSTLIGLGSSTTSDTRPDLTVTGTSGSMSIGGSITNHRNIVLTSVVDVDGATLGASDITQSSAHIQNSTIITDSASGVAAIDDATFGQTSGLHDCSFVQGGSGHAIEITSPGTYNFYGFTFSGYGADTTNSAVIYNNSGGAVTINVNSGESPTFRNGTGASTSIVTGQVTLTLTGLKVNTEVRIYSAGTQTPLAGVEDSGTTFAYTYSYAPSTEVDIVIHNINYQYIKLTNVLLGSGDASLPIQQIPDRWYDNP